jgi:hypothetical protein
MDGRLDAALIGGRVKREGKMNRTVMSPTLYRNKKGEREECSCPSAAVCVRRGLEANPTPTDAEISITRKEEEKRGKVTRIWR